MIELTDFEEMCINLSNANDANLKLSARVAELEADAKRRVLVSLVVEFKDGTGMETQVAEGGMFHWGNIESAAVQSISLRFEDKKI